MKRLLAILVIAAVATSGCTVTISPISKSKASRKHHTAHSHVAIRHRPNQPPPPPPVRKRSPEFTVDAEWMAHYWTLESDYRYRLPEDARIRFEDGKYKVPAVVYRHYEDMMKTPRKYED